MTKLSIHTAFPWATWGHGYHKFYPDYPKALELLEQGADPFEPNQFGMNLLHLLSNEQALMSSNKNYKKYLPLLMEKIPLTDAWNNKVNEDAPDFGGYTPLHYAINAENQEYFDWLLEAGANPTIPNAQGFTVLDYVNKKNENYLRLPKKKIRESINAYIEKNGLREKEEEIIEEALDIESALGISAQVFKNNTMFLVSTNAKMNSYYVPDNTLEIHDVPGDILRLHTKKGNRKDLIQDALVYCYERIINGYHISSIEILYPNNKRLEINEGQLKSILLKLGDGQIPEILYNPVDKKHRDRVIKYITQNKFRELEKEVQNGLDLSCKIGSDIKSYKEWMLPIDIAKASQSTDVEDCIKA